MKILKYFDKSCLVETKLKNHDRMKAADTYFSIHLYTFIASYKNVRLKRELEWLQIQIRVNYMEKSRFDAVNIFSDIFKILSFHYFQIPEL